VLLLYFIVVETVVGHEVTTIITDLCFTPMICRYADGLESGILANANAGGENVARGSLLGALLGSVRCDEMHYHFAYVINLIGQYSFPRLLCKHKRNDSTTPCHVNTCPPMSSLHILSAYHIMYAGAQHGIETFPSWTHALKDKSQIDAEINSLIR